MPSSSDRGGDAEEGTLAEPVVVGLEPADGATAAVDVGEPAGRGQHAQGRDEGREPEERDERAVDETAQRSDPKARGHGQDDRQVEAGVHHLRGVGQLGEARRDYG